MTSIDEHCREARSICVESGQERNVQVFSEHKLNKPSIGKSILVHISDCIGSIDTPVAKLNKYIASKSNNDVLQSC